MKVVVFGWTRSHPCEEYQILLLSLCRRMRIDVLQRVVRLGQQVSKIHGFQAPQLFVNNLQVYLRVNSIQYSTVQNNTNIMDIHA